MASLVQKFKAFTELSEIDISKIRESLYVNKQMVQLHPNFSLFPGSLGELLMLEVTQKEVLTYIEFHENCMQVSVSRNFTEHEVEDCQDFNLNYDASPEWIFQLSTMYDIGFIEGRYMKYLNKLRELYSNV